MLRTIRIAAWLAVTAVLGIIGSVYFLSRNADPRIGIVSSSGRAAVGGPFELVTHHGKPFTNADVTGRPYLVFFGFTHCPDICPTTLGELSVLMDELGEDANRFTPLMITVDPERDTAPVLAEYMASFDSRIIALTGTPARTATAVKAFKAYSSKVPLEGGNYTMDHTAGVFLMKASGEFSGMLDMHEAPEVRLEKLRRLIRAG